MHCRCVKKNRQRQKRTKRWGRNKNKTKRIGSTQEKRPKQRSCFGMQFLDKKRFNSPRHIYRSLPFSFRQSVDILSWWIKPFLDHYRYENNMIVFSAHCWRWCVLLFCRINLGTIFPVKVFFFVSRFCFFATHAGVRNFGTFNVGPWEAPQTVQYICSMYTYM